MAARAATITLATILALASSSAASDRLPVPGGIEALRAAMEMPSSVPDALLLAEAVRAWYGTRDVLVSPGPKLQRMLDYLRSAGAPLGDGPPLPLTTEVWRTLLGCEAPCNLAATLVTNRHAMLLYHGLIAMDRETQNWLAARPALVGSLLAESPGAVAFAAPFVHVRGGAVVLPGGNGMRAAWASLVGEDASRAEPFIRELMRRDAGRLAWLFSVLSQLDAPHLRFALAGGARTLPLLARQAVAAAPEWTVADRPFWRTPFDFSLVLASTELDATGLPRGSGSFWREVFRSDDLSKWRADPGAPLTAEELLDLLFEQPNLARERWEVFCLGQRLPGVEQDAEEAGLILRGARRHPALAQMLDRIGVSAPSIVLPLHRASARVFEGDPTGTRGELGAWQGALALVERAALSGGLDAEGTASALSGLAALRLDDPRGELTAWLMDSFVATLAARPGAPPDAERLVLQVMSGALTPAGPRREPAFTWEDLRYSFAGATNLAGRMEQARAAQASASIEDARIAWRLAAGGEPGELAPLISRLHDLEVPADALELASRLDRARRARDASALRREAKRAAESIVTAALPALAYLPHLAVTESPGLGADVAFRHEFSSREDGPAARRQRPWAIARGVGERGVAWHMQGSLLLLDLSLADWYLRRNTEPAPAHPMFDDGDMTALAQVAALARSVGSAGLRLQDAVAAVEKGRAAAAASASMQALDDSLAAAGIDPWRRFALAVRSADPRRAAALLFVGETWRLGGALGLVCPHPAIDGGAHFGPPPSSLALVQGRRSTGLVGASAVDASLRVAVFLHKLGIPEQLFGEVVAGVIDELIKGASAERSDDFVSFADAVSRLDDARLEEHLLALVADGTLARPAGETH